MLAFVVKTDERVLTAGSEQKDYFLLFTLALTGPTGGIHSGFTANHAMVDGNLVTISRKEGEAQWLKNWAPKVGEKVAIQVLDTDLFDPPMSQDELNLVDESIERAWEGLNSVCAFPNLPNFIATYPEQDSFLGIEFQLNTETPVIAGDPHLSTCSFSIKSQDNERQTSSHDRGISVHCRLEGTIHQSEDTTKWLSDDILVHPNDTLWITLRWLSLSSSTPTSL